MIKTNFRAFLFLAIISLAACSKKNNSNPAPQQPVNGVTSLSISQGPYNASVIITGVGFSATPTDEHVYFNGKEATITAASTTQLTVSVPLTAGTGNVTVKIKDGTVLTGPVFTYQFTYVVSIFAGDALGNSGSADGTGTASSFNAPYGIVADAAGNIFVADHNNNKIRKITPAGVVTTFATISIPWGLTIDNGGNLYCSDQTGGKIYKISPGGVVSAFAGTGAIPGASGPVDGPASSATFYFPTGLAADAAGNIFVADQFDNMIRKITTVGVVSTLAGKNQDITKDYPIVNGPGGSATFRRPQGVAVDAAGNVFVADADYGDIRKITPDGTVSTLAGHDVWGNTDGLGSAASFKAPSGVAVDATGNVFVADNFNNSIRKITPAGLVTTIATSGGGVLARLNAPVSLTLDASGNIYVTVNNSNILKLTLQ